MNKFWNPDKVLPALCFAVAFIVARAYDWSGALSLIFIGVVDLWLKEKPNV